MRILFLTRLYYPHFGGVEKHALETSRRLVSKKNKLVVITERFKDDLLVSEKINGVEVKRFWYPHVKFFGLFYIWLWLFMNRNLIKQSDIVHCHDVFIWYLPFRYLFTSKPVYTTFHGWEGIYPIPWKNIFIKRLAAKLSTGNICVGHYVEKHYGIKADFVTYGAVETPKKIGLKVRNSYIFVGRLEKDTGLPYFLRFLKQRGIRNVDFYGDGPLGEECKKYGKIHGWVDPTLFLSRAKTCFASGYLSALETLVNKCRVMVGWDNPVKRDYWQMTPFYKWIEKGEVDQAYAWAKAQSWEKLTNIYLNLWKIK